MTKYDDLGKPVILEGATGYKSAGEVLNNNQDLIDLQKSSYKRFVEMVIPFYMDQKYRSSYSNKGIDYEIEVEFPNYWIEKDTNSIEHYKKNNLSLESSLYATARITASISGPKCVNALTHTVEADVLITTFPELTPKGALILNGVEKILVSHLEYAYKIRLDRKVSKDKVEKRLFFPIATRMSYAGTDDMNVVNYSVTIESGKAITEGSQVKVKIGDPISAFTIQDILSHCIKGGGVDPVLTKRIIGPFLSLNKKNSQGRTNIYDEGNGNNQTVLRLINAMRSFRLHKTEREVLNKQLSFSDRLIGRTLSEDVIDENGTIQIEAGTVFNSVTARKAALYTNNVQVYNRVGSDSVTVFSNNFLDSDVLFHNYKLETIPDIFKGKKINRTFFDLIMTKEEFIDDKDRIDTAIVNADELLGNYLVKDDLISMINLYGEFLADEVDEDNPDSLSIRNIVNIAELYEEALSRRFPGPITNSKKYRFNVNADQTKVVLWDNAHNFNIVDHIMAAIILTGAESKESKRDDNDSKSVEELAKLRLAEIDWKECIDCKPNQSITRNLPDSLLDLADNTSPMAQANHRRKVSLKFVEKRGGIQSMSSDTRPRTINPSHMGRLDCIESPEGANIGLVRFFTNYAKVNDYGLITTPFFKVNHEMKVIDYTAAYYLDYDTEARYARCLSPKIADEDKIVIELYRNHEDGSSEVIYREDYPVEYVKKPSSSGSTMLLEEQNSPMDDGPKYVGTYDVIGGLGQIERYAITLQKKHGADSKKLLFYKKDWFVEPDNISAFVGKNGAAKTLTADKIDLVAVSPGQIFSAVSGITPFSQFLDGARYAMSDAHQKQAIPVYGRQAARIETGTSPYLCTNASGVTVSDFTGRVKSADSTKVVLITPSGEEKVIPLPIISGSSENTAVVSNVCVKPGDIVQKGDVLADSNMTSQGHLAHGVELVVAYVPFYGMNFEDSIVISDRLIKERLLTSAHLVCKEQPLSAISEFPKKLIRPVDLTAGPNNSFGGDLMWDFSGGGDLSGKKLKQPGSKDLFYKTFESVTNERTKDPYVADFFFKGKNKVTTDNVEIFSVKSGHNSYSYAETMVEEMKNAIGAGKGEHSNEGKFDNHGLIKKGTRVHPNDVLAYYCEVTQKDESQSTLSIKYKTLVYDGEDVGYVKDAYICVQSNVPTIRVIIGYDENIKAADKMSGRHGNKGVISRVLPEVDMLYTEDGRRVDIILTPLGIPSRMNISQLMDCEVTEVLKKYDMGLQLNTMEYIDVTKLKKLISRDRLPIEGRISIMNMDTGDIVKHVVVDSFKGKWSDDIKLPAGDWCLYSYDVTIDILGIKVNGNELKFPAKLIPGMNIIKSDTVTDTPAIKWGIQHTISKPVEIISDRDCFRVGDTYYRDRADFDIRHQYDIERNKTFVRMGSCDDSSRMIYLHIDQDDTPISLLAFSTNGDDDKVQLYDGTTGQPLEQKSTVGIAYMVKSRHQVSHKIAARSYRSSAYDINQSPTQGKAREGGQRLGHMEMWSLAEHGANNVINELLTFKSDDIAARESYRASVEAESEMLNKTYELSQSIIQDKVKDMQRIDVSQKNSPHVLKLVDSKLKSVLIDMNYKNADGESINIYNNIVENGVIKDRDYDSTIREARKAVIRRLKEKVNYYNSHFNIMSTNEKNTLKESLTDKQDTRLRSGFRIPIVQDRYMNKISDVITDSPYIPDPEEGFSEDYYLFGPITENRFSFIPDSSGESKDTDTNKNRATNEFTEADDNNQITDIKGFSNEISDEGFYVETANTGTELSNDPDQTDDISNISEYKKNIIDGDDEFGDIDDSESIEY